MQSLMVIGAHFITRKFWILAYLGIFFSTCLFLSTHAFFNLNYFSIIPGLFLVVLSIFSLNKNLEFSLPDVHSKLNIIALLFLLIFFVYSAFPSYRYDQLSYHLLVNKQIHAHGKLVEPIFQDHFMTGLYEYFFLISRYLWNNDLFVICHANSFSCTTLFILIFGSVQLFNRLNSSSIPPLLISAFAIYSFPERMAITNSKPDYFLAPIAFITTLIIYSGASSQLLLFIGLILGFSLMIKITWIHFALSLSIIFLFQAIRKKTIKPLKSVFLGILGGTALGSIFLIKNHIFYGNAVHPAQIWFLTSDFFSPTYERFWTEIGSKPTTLKDLIHTYIQIPLVIIKHYFWLIIPLVISIIETFKSSHRKTPNTYVVCVLVVYVFLWPAFYGANIFPRFISPLAGLFLLLTCLYFNQKSKIVLASFFLPMLLNSSVEVYLDKMYKYGTLGPEEFLANIHPSQKSQSKIFMINKHIKNHPSCHNSLTLSDYNDGYFLNGGLLKVDGFQNEIYWKNHKAAGGTLVDYLSFMNICYFFSDKKAIKDWPKPFNTLESMSEEIDDGVYYYTLTAD